MSRIAAIIFVLGLLPSVGWAQTWTIPPTLAESVDAKRGVIVVYGGEPTPDVHPAVTAVSKAMKEHVGLVMDDSVLGNTASMSDKDVVTRVAHLPIDRVIIVRVFGETAVVTAYDLEGTAVAGISVESQAASSKVSEPEPASEPEPSQAQAPAQQEPADNKADRASEGTPSDTWAVVGEIAEEAEEDAEITINAWERMRVRVVTVTTLNQYGSVMGVGAQFFKGAELVKGRDVWTAIDRHDLAEQYDKRKSNKIKGLVGASSAVLVGGVMMLPYALDPPCASSTGDFCRRHEPVTPVFVMGAIVASSGVIALMILPFYRPHPVSLYEAIKLYEGYNKKLERRLRERGLLRFKPKLGFAVGNEKASLGATWQW